MNNNDYQFPILNNTYFGNRGYTIYKNNLSNDNLIQLKKLLTIKPYTCIQLNNSPNTIFYVYRESENKIYVPRFFGIKNFGMFKNINISNGIDINLKFNGTIRDIQKPIINSYIDSITKQDNNGIYGGGGLIELATGGGKTICGLNIISILQKKTLIVVHKEFLMNQWIERIQQFLPDAKIGKIQGSIIDIDNKDIVLGMLQSLSMKNYPKSTFDSFGFMIVDEVHHISSEVFSNILFKVVIKYTLGLSATMNRKDGTSYVFKMFLGDIVYKSINKDIYEVEVRKINYISNDEEFNETKTDYKGNVLYSSMLVKLCNFNSRTEFIIRIIIDILKDNDNQHIIILAHNRNLIDYIYDAIEYRNICSVGKYVGGMKQDKLKDSETKKIIVATYSMASEGLDIPTLSTLILATPKTDIVQSVGRILRSKNNNKLIIDICDKHQIFKNQYKKREQFYKNNNYKIICIDSINYHNNFNLWNILYDPYNKNKNNIIEDSDKDNTKIENIIFKRKCLIDIKNK